MTNMTDELLTVYCESAFLEKVFFNRKNDESCLVAYKVIDNLGTIYTDLSKKDINTIVQEKGTDNEPTNRANLYLHLVGRDNLELKSVEDWTGFSELNYADISHQIIFKDNCRKKECETIRKNFGCLVMTTDGNDLFLLKKMAHKPHEFMLIPDNKIDKITKKPLRTMKFYQYMESWRDALLECAGDTTKEIVTPINSLILSDNYMFGKNFEARKEESLLSILDVLIPDKLSTEFHLTIFTFNGNNDNNLLRKETAESLVDEIKSKKPQLKLLVNIVAHNVNSSTHDRHIITNYHVIHSGVGFSVIDRNGIQEVANGSIVSVINGIDEVRQQSLTQKHKHRQMLDWFNDIFVSEQPQSEYFYKVGDNFVNRLLK